MILEEKRERDSLRLFNLYLHTTQFLSEVSLWRQNDSSLEFCGSAGKESTWDAGDLGLVPVLGRSPGEGNGNPIQYSCLENPMNGEAWQATVHGVKKSHSDMTEWLHF